MTDALQQRSRYQCALKECNSSWGIPSIYRVQKTRRLKFLFVVKGETKDTDKNKSRISIIPQYFQSAPNNTRVEWKLVNGGIHISRLT